eukprot:SAG31_NODE_1624_length_7717_cov_43.227750_2_plen_627_part_00
MDQRELPRTAVGADAVQRRRPALRERAPNQLPRAPQPAARRRSRKRPRPESGRGSSRSTHGKKKAKRALAQSKSAKANAARGLGVGSRVQDVARLPPGFSKVGGVDAGTTYSRPVYHSPGGKRYRSANELTARIAIDAAPVQQPAVPAAEQALLAKLRELEADVATAKSQRDGRAPLSAAAGAPPLGCAPCAPRDLPLPASYRPGVERKTPDSLAMVNPARLGAFAEELQRCACHCLAANCGGGGAWVEATSRTVGNGGSIEQWFHCPVGDCEQAPVRYDGAERNLYGKFRSRVAVQNVVGFLCAGLTADRYDRWSTAAGFDSAYGRHEFLAVIEQLYPTITAVLNEDVQTARARVRATGRGATVTADGAWDTRGHFAQNGTYVITDSEHLNALLAYKHAGKRGREMEGDAGLLWGGTSHAMEGFLASLCCAELKEACVSIRKLWMDGDSSADCIFQHVFPDVLVRRCSGHKVKNLATNLGKAVKRKHPDGKNSAAILGLQCVCVGKNHSLGCGCLKEHHVLRIRLMSFANAVAAGTSPDVFAARCHALADYVTGNPTTAIGLRMVPAKRCKCGRCQKWRCTCGHCDADKDCDCIGEVNGNCPHVFIFANEDLDLSHIYYYKVIFK